MSKKSYPKSHQSGYHLSQISANVSMINTFPPWDVVSSVGMYIPAQAENVAMPIVQILPFLDLTAPETDLPYPTGSKMSSHKRLVARIPHFGQLKCHKKNPDNLCLFLELYKEKDLSPDRTLLNKNARSRLYSIGGISLEMLNKAILRASAFYENALARNDPFFEGLEEPLRLSLDLLYKELAKRSEREQIKTHERL